MLDELIIAGEMQESSKKAVLRAVSKPPTLVALQSCTEYRIPCMRQGHSS